MKDRERLFEYEFRVDAIILENLVTSHDLEEGWRLFTHLLAAQELWLSRMEGREPTLPVWPDPDAELCHTLLKRNREGYRAFLATHDDEDRECSYTNSQGVPYTSTIGEILDHLLLHGAYHRGQIALQFRSAGIDPALTDYIAFARGQL